MHPGGLYFVCLLLSVFCGCNSSKGSSTRRTSRAWSTLGCQCLSTASVWSFPNLSMRGFEEDIYRAPHVANRSVSAASASAIITA